jgi:hypothetical protein
MQLEPRRGGNLLVGSVVDNTFEKPVTQASGTKVIQTRIQLD